MKLFELLDKKIPFKVEEKTDEYWSATAEINGRVIQFEATCEDPDEENDWDVGFQEVRFGVDKNGNKTMQTTVDQSGSRGELEVFSMVRDCIKEVVKIYEPNRITFTAFKNPKSKNPTKRSDLYLHLVKKFGNQIPGYKLESRDDMQVYDKFYLVRK